MDTKARSLVKAITWRVVAFCVLAVVSYVITGNITETGEIALVYTLLQLVIYWVHERLWQRSHWGRVKHPLAGLPVNRPLEPGDMDDVRERLEELGYL